MSAREKIIPVFVPHLGCPNDCVFCNQRRISGTQEPATAEDVRRAVEEGLTKIGTGTHAKHTDITGLPVESAEIAEPPVKSEYTAEQPPVSSPAGRENKIQLAFYGGSFTAIPVPQQEELLGAASEYLQKGLIHSIRLSTRPDAIDGTVLERLKRFGVETVEIGAQSMDNEVLRLSGRGHTAEEVESASRQIKAAGFRLILQMMTGLPGDTPEKSIYTAERIIALRPDGVRIYPTVIVRDTALYDMWKAGTYPEHSVENAVELCSRLLPMFQTAGIPVIRLGLNPTDELSSGSAAAGAYHPALGELVKSRILRKKAEEFLDAYQKQRPLSGSSVVLSVSPSLVSQLTGQHRCNIIYLKEKYSLADLKIRNVNVKGKSSLTTISCDIIS